MQSADWYLAIEYPVDESTIFGFSNGNIKGFIKMVIGLELINANQAKMQTKVALFLKKAHKTSTISMLT